MKRINSVILHGQFSDCINRPLQRCGLCCGEFGEMARLCRPNFFPKGFQATPSFLVVVLLCLNTISYMLTNSLRQRPIGEALHSYTARATALFACVIKCYRDFGQNL